MLRPTVLPGRCLSDWIECSNEPVISLSHRIQVALLVFHAHMFFIADMRLQASAAERDALPPVSGGSLCP